MKKPRDDHIRHKEFDRNRSRYYRYLLCGRNQENRWWFPIV